MMEAQRARAQCVEALTRTTGWHALEIHYGAVLPYWVITEPITLAIHPYCDM